MKKKKPFSKKLLITDYIITAILILGFFVCVISNGIYTVEATNKLIEMGVDVSTVTIAPPFNLDGFGVFFSTWIAQLGISSYAYYALIKAEHKIELPIQLLETLPEDIKESVDTTQIINTVLTCTDN